jgi:hypothetical protein
MTASRDVLGVINYLAETVEGQVKYTQQPERSVLKLDSRTVPVHDIRGSTIQPTLDNEGFMVASLPLELEGEADPDRIAAIYKPKLHSYLEELTGARKIVLRDPILRWSRRGERKDRFARAPADYVHGDFSQRVFHGMAREAVMDDPDCDRWLSGRFSVIQTWRVLTPPPQDYPLAMIDRRTVNSEELVHLRTVIGGPGQEQAYWNFSLRYQPAHRWYYLSNMTSEDMLVFIGSESTTEIPGILHSSFDNTANFDNTVPRISCELRAFVYWD